MSMTQKEQKKAVATGYWLLYRYNPELKAEGKNPFILDSKEPELPVRDFLNGETRYTALEKTFPDKVEEFRTKFDKYVKERYEEFKKMAENE